MTDLDRWPREWVDAISDDLRTLKQTSGLSAGCYLEVEDVFSIIGRSLVALERVGALHVTGGETT